MSLVKSLVSKKKKRFQQDGFDLDLSYITPKIVAMGYPAEKFEGVYRNNIDDVLRFLAHYHKNHYRIYNLCSERKYDIDKFDPESVVCYPFDDHNPPHFELIHEFCLDAHEYLTKCEENAIFVHCKAGKGRTGVMIVCYLLYSGICTTVESALQYYAVARTHNQKGVTIPSQIRYINYYYAYLTHCKMNEIDMKTFYNPPELFLGSVVLNCKPLNKLSTLTFKISTKDGNCLFQNTQDTKKMNDVITFITPEDTITLSGDVKVEIYQKDIFMKNNLIMALWFNTFFLFSKLFEEFLPSYVIDFKKSTTEKLSPRLRKRASLFIKEQVYFSIENSDQYYWMKLPKNVIDRINKDNGCKIFSADFSIYIGFLKNKPTETDEIRELSTEQHLTAGARKPTSKSLLYLPTYRSKKLDLKTPQQDGVRNNESKDKLDLPEC